MALELGYILGAEPKLTAIVLNGFLQQNILFDAMAGKLPGYGVEFLEEITTICSMIGMLVLFFSPSLWKAKYLVSWIALFLIVTLGGATGFEFGYNLGLTSGQGILNMPLEAKSNKCTPEEVKENNGFCPLVGAGTKLYEEGIKDASGGGSATVASSITQNNTTIENKLTSNPDNTYGNLSIYAFKPQVFILYLTNKLNAELKSALRGLSSIIMEEKTEVLNMVQNTMPGDPQINQWAQTFETVCKDKVLAKIPNTKFDHILSYTPEEAANLATLLKDDKIQLRDAQKAVVIGNLLQKETKDNVPPLINLNVGPNGASLVDSIEEGNVQRDKDFIKYFTIHKDKLGWGSQNYNLTDPVEIQKKLATIIDLRDNNDTDNYMDRSRNLKFDATSPLTNSTDVAITLLKVKKPISERGFMRKPTESLALVSQADSEYMQFEDCGTLYEEMVKYNNESLNAFEGELDKLINISGGVCGDAASRNVYTSNVCKSSYYGKAQSQFLASKSILNLKDTLIKNCEGTPEECQKLSNDVTRMRNEFALTNSRRQTQSVINEANKTNNISDEGVTGFVADVTEAFTSEFAAAIVGLASIGESIKVGAYSAMLPIIKNILIGFILVLTPIFFLVGLLVPSWSLGVIITPLIALLFLQMTDVTMTIVGSVLDSVDRVLSTNIGYGRDENATYQAFMEMLSAMAYVSSFAITAFLMFAMGDTKTVMSKIAGMDKTIENTGMQIARTGAEMVAAVAKVGAGLATGGAMGGALGAKAANAVAGADAFAQVAKEKGIGTAFSAMGGTTSGNYAIRTQDIKDNMLDQMKDEAEAKSAQKLNYKDNAMMWDEKVASANDKPLIERDNLDKKSKERADKKTRLRNATHAHETNMYAVGSSSINRAANDQGVSGDQFKGRQVRVADPNDPTKSITAKELSVREQFEKSLQHQVMSDLGYDFNIQKITNGDRSKFSEFDGADKDEAWAKKIKQNEADIAKNKKILDQAATMSSAIAQGTYKNMSAENIYKDSKGNMHQRFNSAENIAADIRTSLTDVKGINNDDITTAIGIFNKNYVKDLQENGSFSIAYKQELKSATAPTENEKPGRTKFHY